MHPISRENGCRRKIGWASCQPGSVGGYGFVSLLDRDEAAGTECGCDDDGEGKDHKEHVAGEGDPLRAGNDLGPA